jgi:Na+-translocating ferredoxin:NAD+ oxidoreductase RnfA subunit
MVDILKQILKSIMQVVFSRKFLAFAVVILVGLKALDKCLESENPMAFAMFGVFAGIVSTAVAVYSITNSRVHQARAGKTPAP